MTRQQGPPAADALSAVGKAIIALILLFFWLVIVGGIVYAVAGTKGLVVIMGLSLLALLGLLGRAWSRS